MILMYQEGHYKALNKVVKRISTPRRLEVLMSKSNFGDSAWHIAKAGNGYLQRGEIYTAYQSYVEAALKDNQWTDSVRALLYHYGCVETRAIWAELVVPRGPTLSDTAPIHEEGYPDMEIELSNQEIAVLRKELREGNPPSLQKGCPILLYAKK